MRIILFIITFVFVTQSGAGLLDDANNAYSAGNLYKAIKLYKKAALSGENPALCFYNAGNAYFQIDSMPQAAVCYRQCVQMAPDYFKGYINLAAVYYTLNDIGRCVWACRRALELEPGHQKALLILAAATRKAGDLTRSIVAFEDLAQRYPSMEEPFIALGEIYRDLGDHQTAKKWLMAFPVDGKNLEYISILLADIFESENNYEQAAFYLKRAYKLDTSKQWTLFRLVSLYKKMGNELVALDEARAGLERFPNFAELAVLAGTISYEHQHYEEALREFKKAADLGNAAGIAGYANVKNVSTLK